MFIIVFNGEAVHGLNEIIRTGRMRQSDEENIQSLGIYRNPKQGFRFLERFEPIILIRRPQVNKWLQNKVGVGEKNELSSCLSERR